MVSLICFKKLNLYFCFKVRLDLYGNYSSCWNWNNRQYFIYYFTRIRNDIWIFLIILIASVIIFLAVIKQIGTIFQLIHHLGQKASIEGMYIGTILKIIGIAYITEIGADLTRDAGLHGVATKIELAGKIFILIIAIPIITTVIESILNFLPIT